MSQVSFRVPTVSREIYLAGLPVPIEITRRHSARRLTLRVSETRRAVTLTLPPSTDLGEGRRFVAKHLEWLNDKLERLPEAQPFADGSVVPLRGELHVIRFADGKRSRGRGVVWFGRPTAAVVPENSVFAPKQRKKSQRLDVTTLPVLWVAGKPEHAPRRLQDWLTEQAQVELSGRSRHYASMLPRKVKRVTVRDQASRWGSCSSHGVLSFSWRLIMAPQFVLDYVAAHEAAHLVEMNHGPRYWKLLHRIFPEVEEARRWLRRHGAELHSFGADDEPPKR